MPVYIAEMEIRDAEAEAAPGIGEPARRGSWLRHAVLRDMLDIAALVVEVELLGRASAAVATERSRHREAACRARLEARRGRPRSIRGCRGHGEGGGTDAAMS